VVDDVDDRSVVGVRQVAGVQLAHLAPGARRQHQVLSGGSWPEP
jgi:hypothetical protein